MQLKRTPMIVAVGAALALSSACSTTSTETVSQTSNTADSEYRERLAAKDAEIQRLRDSLSSNSNTVPATGNSDLFPPNAQPGHCYARVLIPANYENTSETVLKKQASFRYDVTAPEYEWIEEQVLAKEASTRLEVIPATYKEVTEQVLVKPETTRLVQVPAQYETVTESILDKPAHTIWKRGSGPIDGALQTNVDQSTGEVVCLVEVPATYKTVSKTVLKSEARTDEVVVPAVYKTVTRRVVDTPASTREVTIPAVYKTVKKQRLVRAAEKHRVDIPAEYVTVNKRKKVSEEELVWREVLCKDNLTNDVIRSIQSALNDKGYHRSDIDGHLGPVTMRSVNRYAKAQGLPVGKNYIAIETAKALDVNY
jgi:hypothetical protein